MPDVHILCSPPSRVLLATDLIDLNQVLPVAVAYAQKFKAELQIAHILPDAECPDIDPYLVHDDRAALERHAGKRLETAVETAAKAGVPCSAIVRSGRTAEALRKIVEEWKPDRVIVGCGRQKYDRHILGSTAEAIMRALDTPVIAISPSAIEHRGLTGPKPRILFAADLDRESTAIARSVVECAQSHHADLTILHVVPENAEDAVALGRRSDAERMFQEIFAGMLPEGPRPVSKIEQGSVVETILRIAQQEHADLIVLGGMTASSLRRGGPLGIAYGVLSGALCPVLTLKAESHAESEQESVATS